MASALFSVSTSGRWYETIWHEKGKLLKGNYLLDFDLLGFFVLAVEGTAVLGCPRQELGWVGGAVISVGAVALHLKGYVCMAHRIFLRATPGAVWSGTGTHLCIYMPSWGSYFCREAAGSKWCGQRQAGVGGAYAIPARY